jgi:tetratricopeptide (TPR) repeat protein
MTPTHFRSDSSARREKLGWSLAMFGVALAVRLAHVWQLRGSLLFETPMGDARSYHEWAQRIAAGDWLGSEVFYQAPLYPYFLAIVYRILGDDPLVVRVLQSAIGAGSCVLLAHAGWRLFSLPAGIAAGLLLALHGPAIFADTTLQKSVLMLLLVCVSAWILAGIVRQPRGRACLALGAAIGALVLVRENALVFAVALAPWLLLHAPHAGARRLLPPALFAVGLALALLPVAARNAWVGGELHLTTSQFGPNFYIGNNPAADGTYAPLRPGRGDPKFEREDATALAEQAAGRPLGPAEVSAYFTKLALAYIASEPADWLALLARKLALTFTAVEIVDTEDPYTYADSSLPLRLASLLHFGVLAPLALLGMWITWPERRRLLPFYLLLLAYTASLVAFYVFGRYRLPLVPLLALFAAGGVAGIARFVRERRPAQLAAPALAVGAAALLCNWPILDADYMRSVTHYNLGNELVAAGRIDEAIDHYRDAIRLHAGNASAHNNLGAVSASRGDLAGARTHYERALAIAPNHVDARFNLARTQWESGELDAAVESYRRGLRVDPGRADVYAELGRVYLETGALALAIQSFERALAIDPSLRDAQRHLDRAIQQSAAEPDGGP